MPADLTDLVMEQVDGADFSEDTSSIAEPVVETPVVETPPAEVTTPVVEGEVPPVVTTPEVKVEATTVDPDELTAAELSELGLKPANPGERENKLPRSRVIQMIGKAVKKERQAHRSALAEASGKYTSVEPELQRFRQLDQLATTDSDKYIRTLAALVPEKYGKFKDFLDGSTTSPKAPTAIVEAKDDPKPSPDAKFPDGSVGYSPEQHQALLDWHGRQVTRQVMAQMGEDLKPFKEERKVREEYESRLTKVRQDIAEVKEQWGDDYPKDGTPEQDELAKFLDEHKELSFKAGVRQWIRPRIKADREKVRAEVIKEQNDRALKQERVPVAAVKLTRDLNEPRSMEDVVRDTVAASGLK